jgi:cytoskeletal protein RodZ
MSALGEEFRSAREARGLSLSDVAEHIHIRSVYLGAIETEDWAAIGAPVYIRGFMRTYARFLGLDAEAAVSRFAESTPSAPATPTGVREVATGSSRARRRAGGGPSAIAIAGVLVAVLLVAFVAYQYFSNQNAQSASGALVATASAAPASPAPSPAAAQPSPAVSGSTPEASAMPSDAASAPARAVSRPGAVGVRFTQRSWIQVTVDGKVLMIGIFPAGTTRSFSGKTVVVWAGNAGGIDVSVAGHENGPLGDAGQIGKRAFHPFGVTAPRG